MCAKENRAASDPCAHARCVNCRGLHHADSEQCPKRTSFRSAGPAPTSSLERPVLPAAGDSDVAMECDSISTTFLSFSFLAPPVRSPPSPQGMPAPNTGSTCRRSNT
ncbi:uncharacterized protein LAESUDRAFT_730270 [Laetiporus sulphureus 93-53]|uniref:Uncharacterized protein n=1 Tax=Laetiporus sulphureus 93-53 TaxID=1314785 RepID=A0A165CBK9_9APHY|nr:uncharacterized protein LAESUDRAFT_730270 [Laetiporus sulphureus 93-53]KZT02513.1 hypothetical protein LAESUDRAFT_730270 [Laetiporus sulphureus 93-53]